MTLISQDNHLIAGAWTTCDDNIPMDKMMCLKNIIHFHWECLKWKDKQTI